MYVHFEKSPLIDYSNDLRFHTLFMYEDQVFKYVSQAGELKNSRISFEIIKLLFKELNFIYSKKDTKFCEIYTLL